ncbi:histidine kinase [Aphanothece hegewaldii CCALA 016]|uniref:histidine kinase n=1 Tax=Aphanothece hegewaldii CCALA 016 TaxID=2107694 RepID=A0A2T1LZ36_9CHRO|nr:PAS domain-containing sensor histidine kinase [Aphanothece hegewaldii]PSF37638.1 histidine kinase [Aphanothece hegewaldii CCALA 016]
MNTFSFIFGLIIGLCICYWQRNRIDSQLQQLLKGAPYPVDFSTSLPLLSLVRREMHYLHDKQQQLEQELFTQLSILEQAPIGYLEVDLDNHLLKCNQQAKELLKIDRWQIGQVRLLLELVRSYELDQLIELTRQTQRSQVKEWFFYSSQYYLNDASEATNKNKSNINKSTALKAYSYPLPDDKICVFIENQQPLAEISQSHERAFSDLTHELRTPLTSISLVAETLQKRLQNPEKHWVEQMLKEINRLIKLIENCLEFGQLQTNPEQYLNYEILNIKELILSAWQNITPIALRKEINLDYQGLDDIFLEGDAARLTQVFLNLFNNCIKYSAVKEMILVKVSPLQEINELEEISIDVIDSGIGFSEIDLPYIFQRLYRGDLSRTRQGADTSSLTQGSGLGLSIAQQIIKAHQGSIIAKNHPQTGGAWIQIILPLKKPANLS